MPSVNGTVDAPLARWLAAELTDPGPFTLRRLGGGNSNETLMLASPFRRWILRRPPAHAIAPGAHSMQREFEILSSLAMTDVAAPAPVALSREDEVPGAPFLLMEHVEGVSLTYELPEGCAPAELVVRQIGEAAIDALVAVHAVDWVGAGLEGFGRPDGFLERQVPRWRAQLERYRRRELPYYDAVAEWLEANLPPDPVPAIVHGDFHVDNCLVVAGPPAAVTAIIDWEMATIGDPLLDLGLFLAFWGPERPSRPAMPQVQGFSRVPSAPSRAELAQRYAAASGRSIEHLGWYMAFALWKLASIVEGAYAQHVDGRLDTPYARALEHDVPALVREAAGFAGLVDGDNARHGAAPSWRGTSA
jgi:aminoglycoside phosphotransferase (APT) family kinase protein